MSSGKVSSCKRRECGRPGQGDDNRRFLADLRALRDTAALEFDELAARAHYPSDVLKEAESGPSLPTLPILAAYVRACDGDVPEWEERWRRLGFESRADPSLPVRPAGASPAAVAGARAGVSVAPPDVVRSGPDQGGARGPPAGVRTGVPATPRAGTAPRPRDIPEPAAAEPRVPESPASWSAGTSWDETKSWDAGAQPGTDWDAGPRWDGAAAEVARHACQREPSREPARRWAARHRGHRDAGRGQGRGHPARSVLRRLAAGRGVDVAARPRVRVARPGRGRSRSRAAADSWFTPREKRG